MTGTTRERLRRPGRRLLAALAVLLAVAGSDVAAQTPADSADAAPVEVRSGNHPSFARLVLVYPDRRRWDVVPTDSGYRVDLAGTAGFDVATVFDLIPRDRIGAVAADPGGGLRIDLACECHLEVLELPGRGLVVDVRDGPAPPGNPFDLLRPDPPAVQAAVPPSAPRGPDVVARVGAGPQLSFGLSPASPGPVPARPAVAEPDTPDASAIPVRSEALAPVVDPPATAADLPTGAPPAAQPSPEPLAPAPPLPEPPATLDAAPVIVELPGTAEPVLLPTPDLPSETGDRAEGAETTPADQDAGDIDVPVASDLATDSPPEPATPALAQSDPSGPQPAPEPGPVPEVATASAAPTGEGTLPAGESRPGRWLAAPAEPAPPGSALPGPETVDPAADGSATDEPAPDEDRPPPVTAGVATLPVMTGRTVPLDITELLPLRLPPAPPPVSAEDAAAAAAFGDMLARQVGRGIAQGVVDAAVAAEGLQNGASAPATGTPAAAAAPADPPAGAPDPTAPGDPLDQIEIATALDRARAEERRLDLPAEAQAACRDDAQFDTAAWVEETGDLPDFAARRGTLVGEFDRVDPDALDAAVRYHVAYGFGAEARQLLSTFGAPSPLPAERVELLTAMSYIVDGESAEATAPLAGQIVCRSRAALWGALALPQLPADADYSSAAILAAFEELPTELRRTLGPELANRFLQIGDMDTVAALRRSFARIDPPDDPATELAREPGALLEARVEAAEGLAEQSEAGLAEVARLDGPRAPEALAELIESQLARGELPDDARVASAAALAMEGRGSEVATRLRRAEILSHVARDDFDRARDALRRATDAAEIPAATTAEIADAYVAAMTARASDRAFLTRLPREIAEVLEYGVTPDTRRAAGERLVALGLPEAALPFIDDLAEDDGARLAAARAWLRLDEPGTALARLAGLEGPEAQRLRAEAYETLGDPGTAAQVLDGLGDTAAAVAAAWRAGDLDRVARATDAPRAQMADLVQSDDPRAPDDLAPLAEHRDLLADIARRREAIAAELARP